MAVIMLDAGHGGANPGAIYMGRNEKDDTLALTLEVGDILTSAGVEVLYTRTKDVYSSPYDRAVTANEAGPAYFVSIHRNSSPYPEQYTGVETLVFSSTGRAAVLARNIQEQLTDIGFKNLGVNERSNLVVLRKTRMPAVLVEVGFINTEADNFLFDSRFVDIAEAIADGILETIC